MNNSFIRLQDLVEPFKRVYPLIRVMQGFEPSVFFPAKALEVIQGMARLRMKNWGSTTRWDPEADTTGLLGEMAMQRYLGHSAEEALETFYEGLKGDTGYDIEL